ncbi:MAG: histidine kinase dimerization/phospho-acceptor domain-containing protein, partial [Rhodothermales bacterium]|nr:histidine kinase dimerization/phospho-acceptor domain-containing protein [Rhodothermales bacterium]
MPVPRPLLRALAQGHEDPTALGIYRALAVVGPVLILLVGLLQQPRLPSDPLWLRAAVSAPLLALLALSFGGPRHHWRFFVAARLYLFFLPWWPAALVVLNDAEPWYVMSALFLYAAVGLLFSVGLRHPPTLAGFLTYNFVLTYGAALLGRPPGLAAVSIGVELALTAALIHLVTLARIRSAKALFQAAEEAEAAKARAERAQVRAEDANRMKSAFLANMNHEIRTPLTGIIGFADLLRDEAPEEQREFVARIRYSADRLLSTLNSVLDLAQIEAETLPIHPQPVDLEAAVGEAAAYVAAAAETKGLALDVRAETQVIASADAAALDRVLYHLLHNAVKFTDRGGVTVRLRTEEQGEAAWACVQIRDTGIGIAPETLSRVFDSFRQGSEGLSRRYEGSGVGLTVAARLVHL